MKLSEFARGISEADVALGRLRGFTCTEEGCEGMGVACDNRRMERTRKVLDRLRELGLPDPSAELGKVVGRPVTVDDLCVFSEVNWLYQDCVSPQHASEERCREGFQRALEGVREMVEVARERKKGLVNLLVKLDGVDRFRLEHDLINGTTLLKLPLGDDRCTLWLQYKQVDRDFMIIYFLPHGVPPAREAGEWLAEYVGEMLGGLGLGGYRTIVDYGEVATRLPDLDPDAALRLFEIFADLAPALSEACTTLLVRHLAGKTRKRVKV